MTRGAQNLFLASICTISCNTPCIQISNSIHLYVQTLSISVSNSISMSNSINLQLYQSSSPTLSKSQALFQLYRSPTATRYPSYFQISPHQSPTLSSSISNPILLSPTLCTSMSNSIHLYVELCPSPTLCTSISNSLYPILQICVTPGATLSFTVSNSVSLYIYDMFLTIALSLFIFVFFPWAGRVYVCFFAVRARFVFCVLVTKSGHDSVNQKRQFRLGIAPPWASDPPLA